MCCMGRMHFIVVIWVLSTVFLARVGRGAVGGVFFFFFSKTGVPGGVCGEDFPTACAVKISGIRAGLLCDGFWSVWRWATGWCMKSYAICF